MVAILIAWRQWKTAQPSGAFSKIECYLSASGGEVLSVDRILHCTKCTDVSSHRFEISG